MNKFAQTRERVVSLTLNVDGDQITANSFIRRFVQVLSDIRNGVRIY